MKDRDATTVSVLRSALSAIDNAGAVEAPVGTGIGDTSIPGAARGMGATEVPRRELTEADVATVVSAEVDDLRSAAAQYQNNGEEDRAHVLLAQAAVLDSHLGAA